LQTKNAGQDIPEPQAALAPDIPSSIGLIDSSPLNFFNANMEKLGCQVESRPPIFVQLTQIHANIALKTPVQLSGVYSLSFPKPCFSKNEVLR